jgi:competence protein ComEA
MRTLRTLALIGALSFCGSTFAAPPVDINTAGAEALAEAIKGVGLRRAEAIVKYRENNGPFVSVDELTKVQGIGERIVDGSRDKLTVKQPR